MAMIRKTMIAGPVFVALCGCLAARTHDHDASRDGGITAQVRQRFDAQPALGPPNTVRVRTVDGVVYLYGEVGTDFQRDMAQSVAAGVPGVVRIVNSIGTSYAGR